MITEITSGDLTCEKMTMNEIINGPSSFFFSILFYSLFCPLLLTKSFVNLLLISLSKEEGGNFPGLIKIIQVYLDTANVENNAREVIEHVLI
jgi:hypothetical protein